MNRTLAAGSLIFFVLMFPAAGCGKKSVPQQSAIKAEQALTALRDIVHDYNNKDLDGFMSRVRRNYKDRQALASSLATVFAKYRTIRFNVLEKKMLIMIDDKGMIRLEFTWDAEWQTREGIVQKDGGRVAFVFDPVDFKLLSIEGRNPFVP